jgi:hypothetical protein
LWGRLKARYHRDVENEAEVARWQNEGVNLADYLADELSEEYALQRPALTLPNRGVEVELEGMTMVIEGRRKEIKNDQHAVNTLRKLDTDGAYWSALLAIAPSAGYV